MNNLFLYWDNIEASETPAWILLCRETIYKHIGDNVNVHIVNRSNVTDYLDNLPKNLYKLKEIAHVADYIRVALLAKHGGIWMDSDCILLKSLDDIYKLLETYDFIGYKASTNYSVNLMASRSGGKVMTSYLNSLNVILSSNQPLEWNTLGSLELIEHTDKFPQECFCLNSKLIAPIDYRNFKQFTTDTNIDITDNYCVMLYNKMLTDGGCNIVSMSRDVILNSPTLIGKLLNISLYERQLKNIKS